MKEIARYYDSHPHSDYYHCEKVIQDDYKRYFLTIETKVDGKESCMTVRITKDRLKEWCIEKAKADGYEFEPDPDYFT